MISGSSSDPQITIKTGLTPSRYQGPTGIVGVLDGMRRGFTAIPMYSLVFLCKVLGGSLKAHPLEVTDVGWFSRDNLPKPMPSLERWIPEIYRALDGEDVHAYFDLPRKQS